MSVVVTGHHVPRRQHKAVRADDHAAAKSNAVADRDASVHVPRGNVADFFLNLFETLNRLVVVRPDGRPINQKKKQNAKNRQLANILFLTVRHIRSNDLSDGGILEENSFSSNSSASKSRQMAKLQK